MLFYLTTKKLATIVNTEKLVLPKNPTTEQTAVLNELHMILFAKIIFLMVFLIIYMIITLLLIPQKMCG